MASSQPMDRYEAADALLQYVYSGILGSTKGKGVGYALMRTTDSTFIYSAALEPVTGPPCPLDRYQIEIDRRTRKLSAPKKIEITDEDMQKAILTATSETVASSSRFTDGGLSISYKVTTTQKPDTAYIVQLRHHGNVASIDALMKFVRANSEPGVIPMPAVYSIPGEAEYQQATGFGRQITQFVPGVIAEEVYPNMPHANKLKLVRKMALAWQACWDLPLPSPRQIGELLATESSDGISLAVAPDRHFSLGGPCTSVRKWLRARLQHRVASLERSTGVIDFKEEYLASIKAFAASGWDQIPTSVDNCPIVAIHVDMGLHNVLVSMDDHTEICAIIDWEFCASAHFLAAYYCIDMLFRMGAPDGFGTAYPRADQLREAFWDAIPKWKAQWESPAAKDFMEWFRFAEFLKPAECSSRMPKAEIMEFWAENRRVVEAMLHKYNPAQSSRLFDCMVSPFTRETVAVRRTVAVQRCLLCANFAVPP